MLVDTHCHINHLVKKSFDTALTKEELHAAQQVIDQAAEHEVSIIINVGSTMQENKNSIELAHRYNTIYATIGIHPTDIPRATRDDIKTMKSWLSEPNAKKIVGIGECGFDFYHPGFSKQKQKDFFVAQIELALSHGLALVVHSRDAYDETLHLLETYKKENLRGVIHCFSYDHQFAKIVTSYGFYLGIGGTVTYPKNESVRDAVKHTKLSSLVLETDAPFLPVQSMRGKTNHPMYIKQIAEFVADIKQISFQEVAKQTTENAKNLFKL